MKTSTNLQPILRCHSILTLAALAICVPFLGSAGTIIVTSNADSGAGSLRAALVSAASGDTIVFSLPTPTTIRLTTGELSVAKNLIIAGPGAALLSISGNTNSRVFNVASNVTMNLSGLTIRDGRATSISPNGGGVFNAGTLTLSNCHVMANQAGFGVSGAVRMTGGTGGGGGGVYNSADLTAVGCTFSGNSGGPGGSGGSAGSGQPGGSGGFGGSGGAICNVGSLTMVSCTVSGNQAGVAGQGGTGGLFSGGGGSGGSGGYGGGVYSAIAASADASKVAAASYLSDSVSGLIFVSTDSGATWSDSGAPIATWTSIASSTNGNKLVAVALGSGIYTRQITPVFPLRITAIAREGDDVRITWETTPGKTNLVQAASSLADGFTDLSPQIIIPDGGNSTTNYVDVGGATNSSRFYRIRLGL